MLSVNDRLQARTNLLSVSIDGEMMILNTEKGIYVSLNDTAAEVLRQLENPRTIVDLCEGLVAVFDARGEEIESDILELARRMIDADLVRIV